MVLLLLLLLLMPDADLLDRQWLMLLLLLGHASRIRLTICVSSFLLIPTYSSDVCPLKAPFMYQYWT